MEFLEGMLKQSILADYYMLGMEPFKIARKYDITEQAVLGVLMKDWEC